MFPLSANPPVITATFRARRTRATVADTTVGTRLAFLGLVAYVISHAFTVPILPVGPWPIWPTLSDLAFLILMAGWFISPRPTREPRLLVNARLAFGAIVVGCAISYVIQSVILANLTVVQFAAATGFQTGAFELVRVIEFF